MINSNSIKTDIALVLRSIGSKKSLEKAEELERESSSILALHLRDLELNPSDVESILSCLKQEGEGDVEFVNSISFSYNQLMGDAGAVALVNNLPQSIRELGLVNCGIGDAGALAILTWMKNARNLQMICMEQNNFSDKMKSKFEEFRNSNARVLVVY